MNKQKLCVGLACFSLLLGCASKNIAPDMVISEQYEARQVPERMDDFAFENDKVAFRFYGPALHDSTENNGTDCWLKRVAKPVVNQWYQGHLQGKSYHIDHGEGYDPFHVGSSLGCGGLTLWQPQNQDPLLQPNVYQDFRVIEKNARQVVFELDYLWPEQNIREVKRITLKQGSQLYHAQSRFTQDGKPLQVQVAVGITNHDGKALVDVNEDTHIIASWEKIDDSYVGTGVILPGRFASQYVAQTSDKKDRNNTVLVTTSDTQGKLEYYAGFAWQKAGYITTYFDWKDYLERYLDQPSTPLTKESVKTLTRQVADWQIAHHEQQGVYRAIPTVPPSWSNRERYHDLDWHHGALYVGMDQWRKIADDRKYTDWLLDIGKRNNWTLHTRPYHADDHTVGQFYLSLYQELLQPEMLAPTQQQFDWILAHPKTGTLDWLAPNTHAHDRWGWCDALFMAPPVWARLAKITGDSRYLEFMDQEYRATYDLLWSKKDQLFWRDSSFFGKTEQNGQDIFWARGNGWVFAGLALMLPDLPKDWQGREFYVDLFTTMAKRIKSIQREDGTWSMGLLGGKEGYTNVETSGTSFFTFGLAWGINQGLLDSEEYRPVVLKAWRALQLAVNHQGMLGNVQPVGAAPGDSFPDYTEVYGVGAFLAAGSELYRLLDREQQNAQ